MKSPKILIVDDEQNILRYLSDALDDEGYEISTKASGTEAVSSLEDAVYDLVLVDLKLRDIDGLEVMREVKKRSPDTVVIMLTGHGSLDSAMEAIRTGASDYLLKPIKIQALKDSLKEGLKKREETLNQKRLAEQARQFARSVIEGGEIQSAAIAEVKSAKIEDEEIIKVSDVVVDIRKHEVRRDDEMLSLTPTEFNLLVTLMNNAGRVLSCKYLVKQVHNYDLSEFDSRSMIRVHIKHLRHKIERDPNNPEYILNVRGLGYKFGT
ncbi:MAG: response regulator transcription factor [Chloroflexi bacterium]|uniref:Response regulator transcription factor n=1 Tax=Candidatus Chlorohelix allophototropha TaxID=3003348 RepID=A0A8T7M7T8_9CHLR|nr:response regulator transcription factor [Chloroflexota bacterium]WJW68143.1 response regulator transcription factor [Chloroflexota bacterium L227-S17]